MVIAPAALAGGVLAGGASCLVGAALDGARGSRLRGWPPWLLALGRLVLAVAGAELGAGGRGRGGGMRAVITAACGGGTAARAVAKVVAPAARREAAEREGAMAGTRLQRGRRGVAGSGSVRGATRWAGGGGWAPPMGGFEFAPVGPGRRALARPLAR